MVVDRASTAGFLVVLGVLYPQHLFVFQALLALDFTSHWMHMKRYARAWRKSLVRRAPPACGAYVGREHSPTTTAHGYAGRDSEGHHAVVLWVAWRRTMTVLAEHTAHSGHGACRAWRIQGRVHAAAGAPRNGRTKEGRMWLAIVQGMYFWQAGPGFTLAKARTTNELDLTRHALAMLSGTYWGNPRGCSIGWAYTIPQCTNKHVHSDSHPLPHPPPHLTQACRITRRLQPLSLSHQPSTSPYYFTTIHPLPLPPPPQPHPHSPSRVIYSSSGHHKSIEGDKNIILRLFYGFRPFFGFCCIGAELCYVLLYMLHFAPNMHFFAVAGIDVTLYNVWLYVMVPGCVCKQLVNIAQLTSAAYDLAAADATSKNAKKN